ENGVPDSVVGDNRDQILYAPNNRGGSTDMTVGSRRVATSFVFATLLTIPHLAAAQPAQLGQIGGTITDTSGGVLPGVTLTAISQDRGFSRNVVSDAQGRYLFPSIPIGLYRVLAELQGFKQVTLADNLVETEKTTRIDIKLEVGTISEK